MLNKLLHVANTGKPWHKLGLKNIKRQAPVDVCKCHIFCDTRSSAVCIDHFYMKRECLKKEVQLTCQPFVVHQSCPKQTIEPCHSTSGSFRLSRLSSKHPKTYEAKPAKPAKPVETNVQPSKKRQFERQFLVL